MVSRFFRIMTILSIGVGCGFFSAAARAGDEPAFIRISSGYYDINDNMGAVAFHLDYLSNLKWWIFKPFGGVMATTDAAVYGYAGIRMDVLLGNRWLITPSFTPGLYSDGDGKDLGHTIEFKSEIEVTYRLDNQARIGLSLYHLSNAGLGDNNPGTEVLGLQYSHPLGG